MGQYLSGQNLFQCDIINTWWHIIMIRLYWNVGSQPARAVKALLQIGEIQHESIVMDLMQNQTRTQKYLSKNHLGQIPFLQTGEGKGIAESTAIMVYLCQKQPKKLGKFYSSDIENRAKINEVASWYQATLRPALFSLIQLKIYGFKKNNQIFYQNQLEKAERQVLQGLNKLEGVLAQAKSGYLCSSGLAFVDLLAYFQATNVVYYGMDPVLRTFPLVSSWYDRIGAIPEITAIQNQWAKGAYGFRQLLESIKFQPMPKL